FGGAGLADFFTVVEVVHLATRADRCVLFFVVKLLVMRNTPQFFLAYFAIILVFENIIYFASRALFILRHIHPPKKISKPLFTIWIYYIYYLRFCKPFLI